MLSSLTDESVKNMSVKKSFTNKIFLICFLTAASFSLFTSCLPEPSEPLSRLVIRVGLTNIDSTLTTGDETLRVTRVRFIHGRSFFTISQDSIILLTGRIRQLEFGTDFGGATAFIYRDYIRKGVYKALTFKITRAKAGEGQRLYDPDAIFTNEGNYSIIINGEFNGKEFIFKGTKKFATKFELNPPLSITDKAKFYKYLIVADLKSWFKKETGKGFLDPTDDKNKKAIYNNIAKSFTIKRLTGKD